MYTEPIGLPLLVTNVPVGEFDVKERYKVSGAGALTLTFIFPDSCPIATLCGEVEKEKFRLTSACTGNRINKIKRIGIRYRIRFMIEIRY